MCEAPAFQDTRFQGLEARILGAVLLTVCTVLYGCKVVILSGPATVATGETVVYVLEVSGDPGFAPVPRVVVDVPVGWQLQSSTYSATVDGTPVTGSGVLVGSAPCDYGPLAPGYQRLRLEPDPSPADLILAGTGEVTLEFLVTNQPSGEYEIFFVFGSSDECSPPAIAAINRGSWFLTLVQTLFNDTDGVDGLGGPGEVKLSPDGRYLYVPGALDASVAVFSRDESTHVLTFVQNVVNGAAGVRGMARPLGLAIAGEHLYVASLSNPGTGAQGGVALFSRDMATGELTFVERFLEDVEYLVASPGGNHLYAAAFGVTVYDRDDVTGQLHFVETVFPGGQLWMNADGRHLYAVGDYTHAYERDGASGQLTNLGIMGSASAAIGSPDGRHFYQLQTSRIDVWDRDDVTGVLTYASFSSTGEPFFTDFESMAISPDGRYLVLGGRSAMRVFRRDKATGALTFLESRYSFNLPFRELEGPRALTFGPDGRYLFATSFGDDALVSFDTWTVFQDGFESATTSAWSAQVP